MNIIKELTNKDRSCEERTTLLSRVEQVRGRYKEIYFRRLMQEGKSD